MSGKLKNIFPDNRNGVSSDLGNENHPKVGFCDDEIVITGFSGRLPECSNMEEFRNNLFNGVDMVNDEPRRWSSGLYDLPTRMGKMKEEDIRNFDQAFFGINPKQVETMDPVIRLLIESTYEAIVDSGFNPQDLRGSRTGVYVGMLSSDATQNWYNHPELATRYVLSGCAHSMFANQISYAFDFCGPSFALDSACSSSLYAMAKAFDDMRAGHCDAAIVAGANILLHPLTMLQYNKIKLLSPDGTCKAFDDSANGIARSDGCVVMFLQKAKKSRRVYSTILNIRTNTDGCKEQGILFPSGKMQKKLIEETFEAINLNPHDVAYVEAHGTGTKVGDPQEVNAICNFFCNDRKEPLLIGSVKSNVGHTEAAAGVCSIAKIIIAMEEGVIPQNLHYKNPNRKLHGITDGRLKVVDRNTPWNGGIVAVNSFGFGGANAHMIVKSNPKPKIERPMNGPRLAVVSGRTEEAVQVLLEDIETQKEDEEYLALVNEVYSKNTPLHNYRGYIVVDKGEPVSEMIQLGETKRPVWFVYSGMGSQWNQMVQEMMQIDVFRMSINRCAEALRPEGFDLIDILTKPDRLTFDSVENSFASIVAVQVALTDVLKHLNIVPDGVVGHSFGELGCAYADGCLTLEQAVLSAYWRGKTVQYTKLIPGAMAAVGLTWEECLKRLPKDILPACNNCEDNVTISGPEASVNKFVEILDKEGIFAKIVSVFGRAWHSKYIADAGPKLKHNLERIIPHPKNRTEKWISSSLPEVAWNTPLAKESSAAYFVNNLLSPVLFHEAIQHIPKNAICIEIAPHGLLQAILKKSLGENVTNLSLMKRKHTNNFQFFLSSIGKLYGVGVQPAVSKLFPSVSYPVGRGTPMLSSKIKWDHSQKWMVPRFDINNTLGICLDVNLSNDEDAFLSGHTIDGRILFPATGYIFLAWREFATILGSNYDGLPVVFENLTFHRATILPTDGSVKFIINFFDGSRKFEICEGDSLAVSGYIRVSEDIDQEELPLDPLPDRDLLLSPNDVYKELRIRGYDYKGSFRGIVGMDFKANMGKLEWAKKNWITFMDTMLQVIAMGAEVRELYLPTYIEKIVINPMKHLKLAEEFTSSVGGKTIFPAYVYKDIAVIKSGGVEMRGLRASQAPKRQSSQNTPKLERYTFVPNYNSHDLSEELQMAREYAITCALHLIIENSKEALKIKTVEVDLDGPFDDTLLSTVVKQIIEDEPLLESEVAIVTANSTQELQELAKNSEIDIIVKDIATGPIVSNYHLGIATNVLTHSNAELILKNLKQSIKEDGFILLEEESLGGYTNRTNQLFTNLNLIVVSSQMCSKREFLLLRPVFDIKSQGVQVINVTEKNFNWLDNLKIALSTAESENKLVYIVCQGEELFGAVGFMNCLKKETGGKFARLFFIQDTNAPAFSLSNPIYAHQAAKDLTLNVLKNGVWGSFRHLKLGQSMPTRKVEHAYVNVLMKGDLSSLKWIEGPLSRNCSDLIDPNFDLYTVYCAPLNFRDVMLSSGKLSTDSLPKEVVNDDCVLGIEFSGRDSEGNRIMAMVISKSLATVCVAKKNLIWPVPNSWTLEEASTIPCVYITVYYALVIRGKMKKGESILIHAGSGGVGQAAISVAFSAGLTVYTTVGTKEKREFLKKVFPQLSDRHIGNSRDCSFEQMIMRETRGRGVDLVLNSLADDKFQASVRCLGENGRFLEIGRYDLSMNNPIGTYVFLKNVSFHGIYLTYIFNDDETIDMLRQLIGDGIKSGAVRPLPAAVFDEHQVEEAFRFMASGKHIGKVVIKVRDEEEEKIAIPSKRLVPAIPRIYLHREKTYVIIGGLGGFGLELIYWLISRGAKKIVATSRNGIRTGYQSLMMHRCEEKGVKVLVDRSDITTKEGAQRLLKKATKLGPVGGIFNLAAVLRDDLFENQQQDDFLTVCHPKVDGTKYLDAASRDLCPALDYFICFSSAACGRGNIGQTNYGLANSAMDRICEARQVAGYPATSIQWGLIGDTGVFIDNLGDNESVALGVVPQRMRSCLHTMDHFMQLPDAVLASMMVAEKRKTESTGQSLVTCVANILGVKNIKGISISTTLVDLGMDSIMGAVIKQTLEMNYSLVLNAKEIRELSFEKLKAYEATLNNTLASKEELKIANKTNVQGQLILEMEAKEVLLRLPSKAAENSQKQPLFVIPGIEGVTSFLKPLAAKLNCPVWGLQFTATISLQSIQHMAKYYISQMKIIQAEGPYAIAGYSYGAAIAYEIAHQLESDFNEMCNVFMLDGSPGYAKHLHKKRFLLSESSAKSETLSLALFSSIVTDQDGAEVMKELEVFSKYEEQLKRCSELVHGVTKVNPELISVKAEVFVKKLAASDAYQPAGKIKSDVTLIKSTFKDSHFINFTEDYDLNTICEKDVKIHAVDGNHFTFLTGASLQKVVEIVQNSLS